MTTAIDTAFVLAAGLGTRMRPLTGGLPKPLVRLAGRALIDHVLDRIAAAGIARAVVNVHYLAGQIEAHLAARKAPRIVISDERDGLLDTGGGLIKAKPRLGAGPTLVHNSDSVWIEQGASALATLIGQAGDPRLDCVLLLADRATCLGYEGRGDFELLGSGVLARRPQGGEARYVFAGASVAHPRLLEGAPVGPFSLNVLWDRAIATGRAAGTVLDGRWMHVGDPAALAAAESLIGANDARR